MPFFSEVVMLPESMLREGKDEDMETLINDRLIKAPLTNRRPGLIRLCHSYSHMVKQSSTIR